MATIGLGSNSGAIVIAAMLLAPLMEPILGISSTLVQGYLGRVVRLLGATLVAAIVTVTWGYVILVVFDIPRGVEIPSEVMSRTSPGLPDHFGEAHEEQRITTVIKDWAGSHAVEIRKIDVHGDIVEIHLLFGVPWAGADERVAPGELVSKALSEVSLRDRIASTLDRNVTILLSGQIVFEASMEAAPPGAGESAAQD